MAQVSPRSRALLRKLRNHIIHAELANRLLHFGIVGIRSAELKGIGLLNQGYVFEAHRYFTRIVQTRPQFGSRIVHI